MSIPVFVAVPAIGWVKNSFSIDPTKRGEFGYCVVGVIKDANATGAEAVGKIAREVGRPVEVFLLLPKCAGGLGVCVAPAVQCETLEEAMALPGFTHLFLFSHIEKEVVPSPFERTIPATANTEGAFNERDG